MKAKFKKVLVILIAMTLVFINVSAFGANAEVIGIHDKARNNLQLQERVFDNVIVLLEDFTDDLEEFLTDKDNEELDTLLAKLKEFLCVCEPLRDQIKIQDRDKLENCTQLKEENQVRDRLGNNEYKLEDIKMLLSEIKIELEGLITEEENEELDNLITSLEEILTDLQQLCIRNEVQANNNIQTKNSFGKRHQNSKSKSRH